MGHPTKDTPGVLEGALEEGGNLPLVPLGTDPVDEPDLKPDEKDLKGASDVVDEPVDEPKKVDPDPVDEPDEPESDEYTEEEWDALPEDEREALQKNWDDHQAAQDFDEDAVKANLKVLEGTFRKSIADTEAKQAELDVKIKESDKFFTQKAQQFKEAAKGHPEVSDKLDLIQEITKQNREDENRQAINFKPGIYFDQSNTPRAKGETGTQYEARLKAGNQQANVAKNKNMLEIQDMISDIISPIMPEVERMRANTSHQKNMYAWGETTIALMEEMKIPDGPEAGKMFADIAKDLGSDLVGQGTSLSPDARANILRSKILLAQSGYKPGGAIQFNGKAPPGKPRGTRKPPRRPPDTIAGRGTSTPTIPGKGLKPRRKADKVKISPEFLTAGGQVPGEED